MFKNFVPKVQIDCEIFICGCVAESTEKLRHLKVNFRTLQFQFPLLIDNPNLRVN